MRSRAALPRTIQEAPELDAGLELYYGAYLDLQTCRAVGPNGPGRISWLTIWDYADRLEYTEDQRDDLLFFVSELDSVFLDWADEKTKQALKTSAAARRKK